MWDYLLAPLDADRAHLITDSQIWHARVMFIAWGIAAPLFVIIARFFKVLPGQRWPERLDSQFWWRSHWIGQSIVLVATLVSTAYMYLNTGDGNSWHGVIGYSVVLLVCVQGLLGAFRGSKGGPTEPAPDGSLFGDHYSMTRRRRIFERLHKSLGYITLVVAAAAIVLGYWLVNAPRWMWLITIGWWCIMIVVSTGLQRRGLALDTYQAIWGPDENHPGNRIPPVGWGVKRYRTGVKPAEKGSVVNNPASLSSSPVKEQSE
jgi:hypothetical protein